MHAGDLQQIDPEGVEHENSKGSMVLAVSLPLLEHHLPTLAGCLLAMF